MKSEIPENEAGLNTLLREWKVETPLPPRFDEQVWQRVASKDDHGVNPLVLLRDWIARKLMRPAYALSYVTVLVILGLASGLWQAHAASQRTAKSLSTRYVQLVDPYRMPRH
jgi:hypothetical protein